MTTPTFSKKVLYDMPAAEYHAIEAMSASAVGNLLRSKAHFWEWSTSDRKQTTAQELGTLVHLGVLEPDRFKSKVWVWDKPEGRGSAADKAAREEEHHAATLAGNVVVEKSVFNTAIRVIDAVMRHPLASKIVNTSRTEVTMLWDDPRHHIPCKSRLDIVGDTIIADLKTATDASEETFAKSAATYLYHAQAAMYWIAHEVCLDRSPEAFVWIVAETQPPYGVACYSLDTDAHLKGRSLVDRAMTAYAEGLRSGKWNAYPQEIRPLRLPRWALVHNTY